MGGGGGGGNRLGDIKGLEERARAALREGRRNVFISFAAEDLDAVNLLRAQAKNERNDIEFNDHSVKEPYDSSRAEYIKQKISERIERASACVVYLSANIARSKWVRWEVERSLELGKKVVATHTSSLSRAPIPAWMSAKGIKIVSWADLADELK
ncbi:TIR domain-containing protein [Roseomonas sp. GCM10028921]